MEDSISEQAAKTILTRVRASGVSHDGWFEMNFETFSDFIKSITVKKDKEE